MNWPVKYAWFGGMLWNKIWTVMVNNSTNINQANSHLSQIIDIQKDHGIMHWNSRYWFGRGTRHVMWLMEFHPPPLYNEFSNSNKDINIFIDLWNQLTDGFTGTLWKRSRYRYTFISSIIFAVNIKSNLIIVYFKVFTT